MQRRVFSIMLFAAVLTTTISACGHNSSAPSNVKQSARHSGNVPKNVKTSPYNAADNTKVSPPNITTGAKLYASTCQSCHGKNGAGTSQGPKLAASPTVVSRFGSETALEAFVAHNMPATDPGSLTPQQATNVSGYVWGLAKK
ncbi:c-type cytochrome [Sulfobacillus sp. hq2]|uniref:c-type cytochrome n=1 Tax=Sulfobacillus TaxID=28033 RepID=UPI000CD134B9|nr:cytochrome c [Sulfobacillus sp. hq2]MCY0907720.1 cytochrome c [Sulfobacillus thermotolerans]POB09647.1 cytochrome C [Sulfobacillus sp. hq2]